MTLLRECLLQCDYYNYNVYQSDYRKIAIHSKKVG